VTYGHEVEQTVVGLSVPAVRHLRSHHGERALGLDAHSAHGVVNPFALRTDLAAAEPSQVTKAAEASLWPLSSMTAVG
jgi:hypothetical protein